MKTRILLLFFLITLIGCHDDEKIPLLKEQSFQLDSDEHLLRIGIRAGAEWQVTGDSVWCKIRQVSGDRMDSLLVHVDVNLIESPRETVLRVSDGSEIGEIQIRQAGATGEYHYRLPTIFHFLSDKDGIMENGQESLDEKLERRCLYLLEKANEFFAGRNRRGIDVNIEFVPATVTPWGTKLEYPGIHWQYHETDEWGFGGIDEQQFIDNVYGDAEKLWDPTKYINIYIFKLRHAAGRTALPYTPANNQLEGLLTDDRFYLQYPPDDFVPSVTIDKEAIFNTDTTLSNGDYGESLLVHELGHYLGLLHVFSNHEDIDDFCEDTPDYDRKAYSEWLLTNRNASLEEKRQRIDRNGNPFTSINIEDYYYSYRDEITLDQCKRIRHVLNYSPMMPGPKIPVKLNLECKSKTFQSKHIAMD